VGRPVSETKPEGQRRALLLQCRDMTYQARTLAAAAMIVAFASAIAAQHDVTAQVQAAEKQLAAGDVAGAAAALEKIVAAAPRSYDARLLLGRALDLQGSHESARVHFDEALKLASDEERNTALTALGISYAFQSKADEAARYYQRAFDAQVQADNRAGAAGLANGLGRIYLESGNLRKAEEWYRTGYEMAKKIPGLPAGQSALWEMRWHHALARIAARAGNKTAAEEHASAVKAELDQGVSENQRPAYPYLLGYIAYYSKDYRTAVAELLKGDQNDPFVLGLVALSYQRLGDREKAAEYSRRVMASSYHSINSAFARPAARAFLR
jgi:Tfp pilus assembly protein PilF